MTKPTLPIGLPVGVRPPLLAKAALDPANLAYLFIILHRGTLSYTGQMGNRDRIGKGTLPDRDTNLNRVPYALYFTT